MTSNWIVPNYSTVIVGLIVYCAALFVSVPDPCSLEPQLSTSASIALLDLSLSVDWNLSLSPLFGWSSNLTIRTSDTLFTYPDRVKEPQPLPVFSAPQLSCPV